MSGFNAVEIKTIPSELTWPIRQQVLRQGKPLEACCFLKDNDPSSIHLGAFEQEKLIGIISLMKNRNSAFSENNQFQLRGMAVLPEYRNKRIGAQLVNAAEMNLLQNGAVFLWCNARENAMVFYKIHGFEIYGEKFEIPEIGPHFLMFKRLKKNF